MTNCQASEGDDLKDSAAQLMATRISELEVKSVMELAFGRWYNCGESQEHQELVETTHVPLKSYNR